MTKVIQKFTESIVRRRSDMDKVIFCVRVYKHNDEAKPKSIVRRCSIQGTYTRKNTCVRILS